MEDDECDSDVIEAPAGKRPLSVSGQRGLVYQPCDVDEWQGCFEEDPPDFDLELQAPSKKLKSDDVVNEEDDQFPIHPATENMDTSGEPVDLPPNLHWFFHLPQSPIYYFATMDIYIESTEVTYKPLFSHVLEFVRDHPQAVHFFGTLIAKYLTSREFLNLGLVCRRFRNCLVKIFESRLKHANLLTSCPAMSFTLCFGKQTTYIVLYTYRSIYKQLLSRYNEVGQTAFETRGRRKIPLPIRIQNHGTMEEFAKIDTVIKAIKDVFAHNTATTRRELRRVLDISVEAIKAHKLLENTAKLYSKVSYTSNISDRLDIFALHLEARLFILMQCPQLIDLVNYETEIITSPVDVKNLVREIHDTLYCLQFTSFEQYVTNLISHLIRNSPGGQLLMVTACFRGNGMDTWRDIEASRRNKMLKAAGAVNASKFLFAERSFDNWRNLGSGSVMIKTCRDLLRIKIVDGQVEASDAVDTLRTVRNSK